VIVTLSLLREASPRSAGTLAPFESRRAKHPNERVGRGRPDDPSRDAAAAAADSDDPAQIDGRGCSTRLHCGIQALSFDHNATGDAGSHAWTSAVAGPSDRWAARGWP
jgi:hypothetical protein